ncbi:hypothetical protein RHSIM_Rhsim09G0158000 [Rhododendron simsii]|uniref:Uncharacterized protein n=1 Tax=Rhododendron simsii TaxID=118357 RepID=A0A834GJC0_RHOSS|nr:hypothetical protein RHSIM_Rhsim09G0158000 [Rhododendron simsii]
MVLLWQQGLLVLGQVVSQYRPLLCWVLSWQSGAITETRPFERAVAGPVTGVTPVTGNQAAQPVGFDSQRSNKINSFYAPAADPPAPFNGAKFSPEYEEVTVKYTKWPQSELIHQRHPGASYSTPKNSSAASRPTHF